MADVQVDTSSRDARGEWQPESLPKPGPLFQWPPRPIPILKFLFTHQGLLEPFTLFYMALAAVSWLFLTPSMERMSSFAPDWMALIYLRNAGLLTCSNPTLEFARAWADALGLDLVLEFNRARASLIP